jgi:hypothetical protein
MRSAFYFTLVCSPLVCGCAGLVDSSGQDLLSVKTQQEMHAKLGEPASRGFEDEKSYEEYYTRRKIAAADQRLFGGPGYAMGLFLTCGLSELVSFPYEVYLVGSRTISGQKVRVIYDRNGAIECVLLDGEPLGIMGMRPRPAGTMNDTDTGIADSAPGHVPAALSSATASVPRIPSP